MRAEKPKESLGNQETSFDLVLSNFERLQAQARSHITSRSEETLIAKRVASSVTFLERQTLHELVPSHSATSQEVADRLNLHDPLFTEQWHLVNDEHPKYHNCSGYGYQSSFPLLMMVWTTRPKI